MTNTEREARLEKIRGLHGECDCPAPGCRRIRLLLSEIDRLRKTEEAASGLVDEGARLVDVGDSALGCDYCGAAILNGQLRHEDWCDWARLKAKLEGEDGPE